MANSPVLRAVVRDWLFWVGVVASCALPYNMLTGNMGIDLGGIGFILLSVGGIYVMRITIERHRNPPQEVGAVPKQ